MIQPLRGGLPFQPAPLPSCARTPVRERARQVLVQPCALGVAVGLVRRSFSRCPRSAENLGEWRGSRVASDRTHHVKEGELYKDRFDEVLPFHEPGLAPVRCGNKAWHIQADGRKAYDQTYLRTFGFYDGRAAVVVEEGKWHHILSSGQEAYSERYEWCGNFQGHCCPVRMKGRYFHIDLDGRPLYQATWRYAGDFREGSAVVHGDGGSATHVRSNGELLHGQWFQDLDVYHKGLARARDSRGWFHVNVQGKPQYSRRFGMVEPFYNGQARVQSLEGGWEVIGEDGETLLQITASTEDPFASLSADLVGFWKTQTLCAAVELGVFEGLPASLSQLSALTAVPSPRLRRLLRALEELRAVRAVDVETGDEGCVWRATERGELLRAGHYLTLADAALEYGRQLSEAWLRLPSILRSNSEREPEIFKDVASSARCLAHHRMLRSYARRDYAEVPKLLQLRENMVILDVGGGTGTLAKLFLEANDEAEVFLLDLPEVLQQVEPLPNGLRLRPVDLQDDWSQHVPLADAVVLARVLHDFHDRAALQLLQTAHRALKKGGRVVVVEFLPRGSSGGLCDLHLLAVTGGAERNEVQLNSLLREAGFDKAECHKMHSLPSVLIAKKL